MQMDGPARTVPAAQCLDGLQVHTISGEACIDELSGTGTADMPREGQQRYDGMGLYSVRG